MATAVESLRLSPIPMRPSDNSANARWAKIITGRIIMEGPRERPGSGTALLAGLAREDMMRLVSRHWTLDRSKPPMMLGGSAVGSVLHGAGQKGPHGPGPRPGGGSGGGNPKPPAPSPGPQGPGGGKPKE